MVPISTTFQLADLFTKVLPAPRFKYLVDSICGLNPAPLTPRTISEKVGDMVSEAAENMLSLKDRIELSPADPKQEFFENHFQEPDLISLQTQAGLHQSKVQLTNSPTTVQDNAAAA